LGLSIKIRILGGKKMLIKPDFKAIADIFRLHLTIANEEQTRLINLIIESFIPFLKEQNINFNEIKFRNYIKDG